MKKISQKTYGAKTLRKDSRGWMTALPAVALSICLACLCEAGAGTAPLYFDFSGVVQPVCPDQSLPVIGGGQGLDLQMERAEIRAGERWAEVFADITLERPLEDMLIKASIHTATESAGPLAEIQATPESRQIRILIDMRSLNITQGRVRLELSAGTEILAAAETFTRAAETEQPLFQGDKIEVQLDPPIGYDPLQKSPVTFGVPFAPGAVWNPDYLRLVDNDGMEIPSQKQVTALWAPDGSVKWMRFDALVSPARGCRVEVAQPEGQMPADPVQVTETADGVSITIGTVQYELARDISPVARILMDGKPVAEGLQARGLYVVDQNGREARMAAADLQMESQGPLTACARLEGDYLTADGTRLARHITRLEFFAGRSEAKITHTLVLTEDSNEVWFREIGWEMKVLPGADPRALFGISRTDPQQSLTAALTRGKAAHIIQEQHTGISGRTNYFVARLEGESSPLAEGEAMGDWAALLGGQAGLVFVCKDAAWRHPKEFEATADGRLILRLFSNRAGEELDFRATTLAEKWDLAERMSPANLEEMRKHTSNAAGWAKTHELWLAPVSGGAAGAESAARIGALPQTDIYALADPMWIYRSNAMGPIYPRDTERFPREEQVINAYIRQYIERVPGTRYLGFIDYYAGPHYGHAGRYRLTYTLLHDAWIVYARAGDREVREFAQGANRAFMDNYIAHWDTPNKRRGLFINAAGGRDRNLKSNFPFYWEERTNFNMSTTANLNQIAWDYYLTGNRRARDIMDQYAEAIKTHWAPGVQSWRVILTLRMLLHSYEFTWDPVLRMLIENTTVQRIYDPESAVALSKNRPYSSSTYKTPTDIDVLIEAWELMGTRHYHEMAMKVAEHHWDAGGIRGRSSGLNANFLYRQTGRPDIAAGVEYYLRTASKVYDEEEDSVRAVAYSQLARNFQGLPYSMDVIVRSGADQRKLASWIDFDDYGAPADIFVRKTDLQNINLLLRLPRPDAVGLNLGLQPVGDIAAGWAGMDLNRVAAVSGGFTKVHIPRDAPEGAYKITPGASGKHFVLADDRVPLVFYAPDYWIPNTLEPPVPIYFRVPEGTHDAKIFFENTAQLFQPDGTPLADGADLTGWVDLPADKPGLWSFMPVENGLVRGANFPPFYTMGDPDFYFEPDIEFTTPAAPVKLDLDGTDTDALYVTGVGGADGDLALHINDKRSFRLASGENSQFLPYHEGTIEFYFRPDWSTFDIKNGMQPVSKSLIGIATDTRSGWGLLYRLMPEGSGVNMGPTEPSHAMYGVFQTQNPEGVRAPEMRCWLTRTLFKAGEWTHIAWVWGNLDTVDARRNPVNVPYMDIYINGRGGRTGIDGRRQMHAGHQGNLPVGIPQTLTMPRLRGAVDQLRISDVRRYQRAFTPPAPDRELQLDQHTRALFLFNGDINGKSWQHTGPLPAEIVEH